MHKATQEQLDAFLESRRNGVTVESAAAAAGLCDQTIYNVRDRDPAFKRAMVAAAERAISSVEGALFKNAMTPEGKTDRIFFLCNRAHRRWKSVQHIKHSGDKDGDPIKIEQRIKSLSDGSLLEMDRLLDGGPLSRELAIIEAAASDSAADGNGEDHNGRNGEGTV